MFPNWDLKINLKPHPHTHTSTHTISGKTEEFLHNPVILRKPQTLGLLALRKTAQRQVWLEAAEPLS